MEWTEVKIYTTTEGIEPVTAMLLETGVTGIQVEDDRQDKEYLMQNSKYWDYVDEELLNKPIGETRLTVYVSSNPYGNEILLNIKNGVEHLKTMDIGLDMGRLAIETTEELDDQVWLNKWKEFYKPFNVGEKLFIKPVWEEAKAPEGRTVFIVNPGNVFGTGLHQTTQLCMIELEKYVKKGCVMADLGCGSGILSIVSLLLGADRAFAVDIDANAIKTAYENAELNGVSKDRYYVTSGNVMTDEELRNEIGHNKYDVVAANIIADVIMGISPFVPDMLKKDGVFIASGIIKDRMDDVYAALEENGFKVLETNIKDEWVCIVSCLK